MKKIILIFILPLTLLMAEMTLTGTQLSITDNTQTPDAGTSKTNWGFQPFTVPSNSVTVPVGGNIQAAINSLSNGGTVYLKEGTYTGHNITVKSNIEIVGAGINKTTINYSGPTSDDNFLFYGHGGSVPNGIKNVILKGFKANCTGTAKSGMLFIYGISNMLFEDLEVVNAGTTGIIVNNSRWSLEGKHFTYRNVEVHTGCSDHGINLRYSKGAVVDNCNFHNVEGIGMDFSSVLYTEIANTRLHDNGTYGSKFPNGNYIYVHDTTIRDNYISGLTILEGSSPNGKQHFHFSNLIVERSGSGIVDFGNPVTYTAEEIVVSNVILRDNISYDNKIAMNHIRVKGAKNVYEYNNGIDLVVASRNILVNVVQKANGTPEADGVGWTSWPVLP